MVLEGGGMRGVFTSGVLDAFMKHEVYFRYVVAVSAGACNGLSYMSRQIRRARISNIDFMAKYDYIGLRHFVKHGSILDQKLLYDDFPNTLLPYDYDTYFSNPAEFEMVTTSCLTGRPCYLCEKKSKKRLLNIVKASSSMPYVCKIVTVDGVPMLDGGIVDSIPVMRAIERGHLTNVVVQTRQYGFRTTEKDIKVPKLFYKKYPRLRVALSHRCEAYNNQLAMVERLEAEGRIVCIRPQHPVEVGRVGKDLSKLESLYEEGFEQGERFIAEYMNKGHA